MWRDGPYLLSNAPTHTHWLEKPIEAARFRFVTTGGGTWPAGNIRLGELVFHGQVLGASHPDVLSGHPVAVLFDENEEIAKSLAGGPDHPISIVHGGAYSGDESLALTSSGIDRPRNMCGPSVPPSPTGISRSSSIRRRDSTGGFSSPGRPLTPATTGMSLLIGRTWPEGGYAFEAGAQPWPRGRAGQQEVAEDPPRDWQVVRVDLWDLYRHPVRIRALNLAASGGGAAFDRILLGRTKEDLDRAPTATQVR